MQENTQALRQMEEANHIIQEFPVNKYALYLLLFSLEIAFIFWVALKI